MPMSRATDGDDVTRLQAARAAESADGSDATVLSTRTPPGRSGLMTMQDVGDALEGKSLGVYHLEQFVGGGGMGAVFRALDTTLDRTVAVKVLFAEQSADDEVVRRFRNEAQSAARLNHDNIGRVHAVGYEDGWHFIVFEFIEGRNLRDIVAESGPFDVPRTIDVAVQIAEALAHATEREVVHRDIKPSNIIITPDGRAKLVDMGLARLHQMAGVDDLTVSGMTLGTFDYISPEQARDPRGADVRSDLYSLGCTLYFLLVGRPPFAEGTMVQKLLQHQQDPPPAIESSRQDVPRKLSAAVMRLMQKDPADRYQHPEELVEDLAGLAKDHGIAVNLARPTTALDRPVGTLHVGEHLPWVVPLACLAAIVAALWWTGSGGARLWPLVSPALPPRDAADTTTETAGTAGTPRLIRLSEPAEEPEEGREPDALSPFADAVAGARDGDIVELDFSSETVEHPLRIEGKRIVIRASEGKSPRIRFTPRPGTAAVSIAAGAVSIEGIGIRHEPSAVGSVDALFRLESGSSLELRRTEVVVDASAEPGATPVAIDVVAAGPDPGRRSIRIERSVVSGDMLVVQTAGTGEIDLSVLGTQVSTPRRFLLSEGGAATGCSIKLSLDSSRFSCGEGFACLLDSPARPATPRLLAVAKECRFAVPEGASLLEQSGIDDPDVYRRSVEWLDAGSRYEGSDVFRRIDGAAERVEVEYAASPLPMEHVSAESG